MLTPYHALDLYPTRKGCSGIETCTSCSKHLAEVVAKLESGQSYSLPLFDLMVWDDGTYSVMARQNPSLN